ncbi:MtrB/PioB family outer membrane beta-barrel protein [Sansalvadorimonas sp. 2012CJ34-2]|uniref:MtrB/PioB family outer membrane beta-barrel protein n=1 Tax=Parendozoicomonas callyspongiae TaxID=2942213 RepID=A0ABT0PBM6_9GAMM|nr:MtrB/PioB family outer membrane beta-barrel protein [Sansalvadorimonas sp. 2012CJ34-2]MCL6268785.1 MtrB/PioB family outer membrane beta-barrel protein [Sansalvadorimonas sp. 2012CJ34-2]
MTSYDNKKTLPLTLLSAAIAIAASQANAAFDLSRMNRDHIDTEKRQCSSCPDPQKPQTSVYASMGYLTRNNASQIIAGQGDKQGLQGNAGFDYRDFTGTSDLIITALGGTGREYANVQIRQENNYQAELTHNSQNYVKNHEITIIPPTGSGGQLGDYGRFDEEVVKSITALKGEKKLTNNLIGFADFIQRKNSGNGVESDHFAGFTLLGAIPKEIDNTTHELRTGLRHATDTSHLQAYYKISRFDNDANIGREVAVGQGNGVGGGNGNDQGQATRMPEPDSTLHQAVTSGSYRISSNDIVQGSLSYGLLGQDGNLVGGQIANNGDTRLEGYIHTARSRLRWLHRISPKWRFKAAFNYDNRKNATDPLQKTGDNNAVYSTRLFSYRIQDFQAGVNGQLGQLRIEAGAGNKVKWRSDQNRKKTEEKSAWIKSRQRISNSLLATMSYKHLDRGGSDFENKNIAIEPYLADMKQDKVTFGLSYGGFERAGLGGQVYTSRDNYNKGQSGLDRLERSGMTLNGNYRLDDNQTLYVATTLERNEFEQSIKFNTNTTQIIDQKVDMLGITLGFEWERILDSKFDLDLSYNWLKSIDNYHQKNATNPIPDIRYRSDNFEVNGKYKYSDQLTVLGLIGYQHINEDDWQLDNTLWTGNKTLGDDGYRIAVGFSYKFL